VQVICIRVRVGGYILANRICMILPFKNIRKIPFHFLKNTQKGEAVNANNWICWPWFSNKDRLLLQWTLADYPLATATCHSSSLAPLFTIYMMCELGKYIPQIYSLQQEQPLFCICPTSIKYTEPTEMSI